MGAEIGDSWTSGAGAGDGGKIGGGLEMLRWLGQAGETVGQLGAGLEVSSWELVEQLGWGLEMMAWELVE
jgi:hypothetical protein